MNYNIQALPRNIRYKKYVIEAIDENSIIADTTFWYAVNNTDLKLVTT